MRQAQILTDTKQLAFKRGQICKIENLDNNRVPEGDLFFAIHR